MSAIIEDLDLDAILLFAKRLAREVGKMMKDGQEQRMRAAAIAEEEKASSVDLVTEVDKAVEAYIRKQVSQAYPTHEFIGEETYKGDAMTDAPTWIIFIGEPGPPSPNVGLLCIPIDGTANFVHGHPDCCTSIGLAVGGVPIVGVIYNPFLDHIYYAAKGKGAYWNDLLLPLYGRPRPLHNLAARVEEGGKHVHGLRISGSAAMSIAMTCRGAVDMYAEIGARSWDVCAGLCILYEAGGICFGPKGSELDGQVDAKLLFGRKFLFVRNINPEGDETTLEAQQRIGREYFGAVEDYDP